MDQAKPAITWNPQPDYSYFVRNRDYVVVEIGNQASVTHEELNNKNYFHKTQIDTSNLVTSSLSGVAVGTLGGLCQGSVLGGITLGLATCGLLLASSKLLSQALMPLISTCFSSSEQPQVTEKTGLV